VADTRRTGCSYWASSSAAQPIQTVGHVHWLAFGLSLAAHRIVSSRLQYTCIHVAITAPIQLSILIALDTRKLSRSRRLQERPLSRLLIICRRRSFPSAKWSEVSGDDTIFHGPLQSPAASVPSHVYPTLSCSTMAQLLILLTTRT
jgi:hypothetical protein